MGHGGRIPTIILCGGRGTRISEVSTNLPKPLLPIGDRPVLWHIMKIYAAHGHTDFVLALGWLGDQIRRFVLDYEAMTTDFTVELGRRDHIEYHHTHPERGWRITCVETGRDSLTGTRVRRAVEQADLGDGPIMVTYGDGVADVDVSALLRFHREHGKIATVTAVRPPARFGGLEMDGDLVAKFAEKPQVGEGWINGGFLVFEPAIFDYLNDDTTVLESHALERLAQERQLAAFRHDRFWQCMDTLRDKQFLERLWQEGRAPWRSWS
jgi:glucose-1-phosphate cytidylyltransferase